MTAAATAFCAKGYAGASTLEIARAANTSESTIYRHFSSKAELFSTAVLEPFDVFLTEYEAFFQEVMAADGWTDKVITERCIQRLYEYLRDNRHRMLAMISVLTDPNAAEPAREAVGRMNAFFDALYVIGLERWRKDPSGLDLGRLRLAHRFLVSVIFAATALDRLFLPPELDAPSEAEVIAAMTQFIVRGTIDYPHGASGTDDGREVLERLERLVELRTGGMLTEDEFTRAKERILNLS